MSVDAHTETAVSAILAQVKGLVVAGAWEQVLRLAEAALLIDPGNPQAEAFRTTAAVLLGGEPNPAGSPSSSTTATGPMPARSAETSPGEASAGARGGGSGLRVHSATRRRPATGASGNAHGHGHSHALEDIVAAVQDFAPFSPVASELLAKLDDDVTTMEEIARLAATDQALTARVLRAANSAFYQRRVRVSTVRDALVVLGAGEVRQMILAACLVDASPATNYIDQRAFWRFSLLTGLLAEMAARARGAIGGEAFTAGVIHNVGLLALDVYCPDGLAEVLTIEEPGMRRLHDRERVVFGFTDAELSARLATEWHLPRDVIRAVASHGLRRDEVNERDVPTNALVSARIFARSQGVPDGLEHSEPREAPAEWREPPLSTALQRAGGWERLLSRIDAFLDA